MKKIITLIFAFIVGVTNQSCGQSAKKENQNSLQETIEHNGQTYVLKKSVIAEKTKKPIKSKQSKIIFQEVQDTQRNMLVGLMPLPQDWKIHSRIGQDQVNISGPNAIKIYAEQGNGFWYSELPGLNQMMANKGHTIKPPMSVENLVKNVLGPALANTGGRLTKQYHHTELQKYAENYDQFTFKSVPMRKEFKAYVTEWEGNDDSKLLFVINYFVSHSQEGIYWGYYANMMEAPKTHFEKAKNDYLYALINRKYNPQWLQTCYMQEAQKAAQRGELHQQRMAALRAEGQAIIERGKAYSAQVDANHKRFMDAHLERTNVTSGGQTYQVDAGANEYWINSNGEYISSNNYNYDPNMDTSVNNQNWTKTTIQN